MDRERIIETIRRLRALATSSNEHEAALAAQKATEMLQKYNLSMADIPAEELMAKDEPIDSETMFISKKTKGSYIRWKRDLMATLARGNFCDMLMSHHKVGQLGDTFYIIGKPHNREVVFFLFNVLSGKFEDWSKAHSMRAAATGVWSPRKSFLHGAVEAVRERMHEQRNRFQSDPTGKSLVLLNATDKALDMYKRSKWGKLGRYDSGDHDMLDGEGFAAGYAAGKSVEMQSGVGAGSERRKALNG